VLFKLPCSTSNAINIIYILTVLKNELFMTFGKRGRDRLSLWVSARVRCRENAPEWREHLGTIRLTDKSFPHVNINMRVCSQQPSRYLLLGYVALSSVAVPVHLASGIYACTMI
jgi:hypothetical protein